MAGADKTLILIGHEGPELKNDTTGFYWPRERPILIGACWSSGR
jgi:hypothetical protein